MTTSLPLLAAAKTTQKVAAQQLLFPLTLLLDKQAKAQRRNSIIGIIEPGRPTTAIAAARLPRRLRAPASPLSENRHTHTSAFAASCCSSFSSDFALGVLQTWSQWRCRRTRAESGASECDLCRWTDLRWCSCCAHCLQRISRGQRHLSRFAWKRRERVDRVGSGQIGCQRNGSCGWRFHQFPSICLFPLSFSYQALADLSCLI